MPAALPDSSDGAVFPPRHVRGPGRRPPLVPAAFATAIAGLVVIGMLLPPGATPEPSEIARASAAMGGRMSTAATERPTRGAGVGPAEVIRLDARPDGRHLFVHGEVFSLRVFVVIVSVRDMDGRTLDIRTLDMPGGSTAFRIGSVNRFDVRFDRPDPDGTRLVIVQARGYDAAGDRILSEDLRVGNAQG